MLVFSRPSPKWTLQSGEPHLENQNEITRTELKCLLQNQMECFSLVKCLPLPSLGSGTDQHPSPPIPSSAFRFAYLSFDNDSTDTPSSIRISQWHWLGAPKISSLNHIQNGLMTWRKRMTGVPTLGGIWGVARDWSQCSGWGLEV